ncbi:hypothetical protein [Paucisalibacillus sp. EB02]|uniref:hypothetical protein n=1 Tax=Paucisalibacillus sp. EB02 TaxID=1347087 RepID=UPI0005A68753|nr:hypothetical protein [Paucisalibacillus sp. EB02]
MGKTIILLIVLMVIIAILTKKNILTLTQKSSYKYVKGPRKATFSYKYFNGIEHFQFEFIPNQPVTIHYQMEVEQGQLVLLIGRPYTKERNADIHKLFTESTNGSIEFTPTQIYYTIRLEGLKTRGSARIEY